MIGLDSNVLIRYAVLDDKKQASSASRLIEAQVRKGNRLFLNRIVLCELVWVLQQTYGYTRSSVLDYLETLFNTGKFELEDSVEAWEALKTAKEAGADFADAYLGLTNEKQACVKTMTFDRKASRLTGFELMR